MKKLLYLILPEKTYLATLHLFFYLLYDLGFLKGKEAFKFHYFVKRIIEPEFVVVDIGANLGYFTKNFARIANKGKVIAIEPLPQFHQVLKRFLGKKPNVELHNVALGANEGSITMVLPQTNGMLRTGLPHIMRAEEKSTTEKTQIVQMLKTSAFFNKLEQIDYIKCDIEGHEWEVFSTIKEILAKKRPIVQLEIDPRNEENMFDLFEGLDYIRCGLKTNQCLVEQKDHFGGDYLFVPREKSNLIAIWNG